MAIYGIATKSWKSSWKLLLSPRRPEWPSTGLRLKQVFVQVQHCHARRPEWPSTGLRLLGHFCPESWSGFPGDLNGHLRDCDWVGGFEPYWPVVDPET